ncbi:MAG: hypothetical protein HYU64_01025 [Armatimonadetes bacterium]|nr:hypothetical protein [Armatimonadota bacterium]
MALQIAKNQPWMSGLPALRPASGCARNTELKDLDTSTILDKAKVAGTIAGESLYTGLVIAWPALVPPFFSAMVSPVHPALGATAALFSGLVAGPLGTVLAGDPSSKSMRGLAVLSLLTSPLSAGLTFAAGPSAGFALAAVAGAMGAAAEAAYQISLR